MANETSQLLALCGSIMSDGEVSPEEAWGLADWLNNHPDAAATWPGSELIEPLQEIWADGSVNGREMHRLARLLISVQREWARRPESEKTDEAGRSEVTGEPLHLDGVTVPSVNARFRVPSQTEAGIMFEVDLSGPRCTCPDWRGRRSHLPQGHLTRCCKHILSVYAKIARRKTTDELFMAFIDNGFPPSPGTDWKIATIGGSHVLFCTCSEKGWANVFAKDGGKYERFGYSVPEERWAYGIAPAGAAAIARAICRCGSHPPPEDLECVRSATDDSPAPSGRNRTMLVAIVLMLAAGLAGLWAWRMIGETRVLVVHVAAQPTVTPTIVPTTAMPSPPESPRTFVESQSIQPPKSHPRLMPTAEMSPAHEWTTRLIRPARVTISGRSVVLPSGTRLRVLGRSNKDVMVSYQHSPLTIPLSSTDLR